MDEIGQVAAVALVLALLAVTLWWLRRRGIAGVLPAGVRPGGVFKIKKAARRLECMERLPLGPHHTLHLVRLGETALLVASSPGGCSLVRSFSSREIAGCGEMSR
jgi:flagellar biogenesis protein FliO